MALHTRQGTGGAVRVSVADGSTFETVANLRSWSVEESADTVEDTNMSSASRTYKTTHKTWTASADVYITYDDAGSNDVELFSGASISASTVDTMVVGTSYEWEFYADDSSSFAQESYTGTGIVTGISRSSSHDGMTEMSVTIQGNSLLT